MPLGQSFNPIRNRDMIQVEPVQDVDRVLPGSLA